MPVPRELTRVPQPIAIPWVGDSVKGSMGSREGAHNVKTTNGTKRHNVQLVRHAGACPPIATDHDVGL